MRIFRSYIILMSLIGLTACNDFEGDDPNLHGSWTSGLQTYYFNSDMTFSYTNNFSGDSINPVHIDSVFGNYSVDTRRSNLSFEITGYKLDSNDVIVYEAINGTTWEYSINNDQLKYTSNTSAGVLTKL